MMQLIFAGAAVIAMLALFDAARTPKNKTKRPSGSLNKGVQQAQMDEQQANDP